MRDSSTPLARCLLTVTMLVLCGCADYRFSVNERVIYNPDELFSDYEIPDPGLRACVEQHIRTASVTAASQLVELDCRDSDVKDLKGLSRFENLHYLNLFGNADLPCTELAPWHDKPRLSLTAPAHCPG